MRIRRAPTVLVAVVLLLVTACEGRVSDPAGDAEYGVTVDIVEAGVDYRTESTRLWITFAPSKPGLFKRWGISTNGDTTEEFVVAIGSPFGPDEDRYRVTQAGSAVEICAGFVSDAGAVGNNTYELSVHSKCFRSLTDGSLPGDMRFIAYSESHRSGADRTTWSSPIPRS